MTSHAYENAAEPSIRRLRLSQTLTKYIARQFLFWFGSFFFAIVSYMTTGIFLHFAYIRYFWLMLARRTFMVAVISSSS